MYLSLANKVHLFSAIAWNIHQGTDSHHAAVEGVGRVRAARVVVDGHVNVEADADAVTNIVSDVVHVYRQLTEGKREALSSFSTKMGKT